MPLPKIIKDHLIKILLGKDFYPKGLVELNEYFRNHKHINFRYQNEGDCIIAISKNFKYGSIVTSGKNMNEVDANIKDAILTAFEIPSSYADQAKIVKKEVRRNEYAFA